MNPTTARAEQGMRTDQDAVAANVAKLPAICFGVLNTTGDLILMKAGETGYWPAEGYSKGTFATWDEVADFLNEKREVSKAQRAAMEAGSLFGFHVPAADPATYNADGKPTRGRAA